MNTSSVDDTSSAVRCVVCGKSYPVRKMHKVEELKPSLRAMIAEDVSGITDPMICDDDLARCRRSYVEKLLNDERGELSELDRRVLDSIEKGASTVQSSAELALEPSRSFGERAADAVASFGGSWSFIGTFGVVLILWMLVNASGMLSTAFDPATGRKRLYGQPSGGAGDPPAARKDRPPDGAPVEPAGRATADPDRTSGAQRRMEGRWREIMRRCEPAEELPRHEKGSLRSLNILINKGSDGGRDRD